MAFNLKQPSGPELMKGGHTDEPRDPIKNSAGNSGREAGTIVNRSCRWSDARAKEGRRLFIG
jgi:hypothetical protein